VCTDIRGERFIVACARTVVRFINFARLGYSSAKFGLVTKATTPSLLAGSLAGFVVFLFFFFFQAEDGIRDDLVTGVQTCALPICSGRMSCARIPSNPVLEQSQFSYSFSTRFSWWLVL